MNLHTALFRSHIEYPLASDLKLILYGNQRNTLSVWITKNEERKSFAVSPAPIWTNGKRPSRQAAPLLQALCCSHSPLPLPTASFSLSCLGSLFAIKGFPVILTLQHLSTFSQMNNGLVHCLPLVWMVMGCLCLSFTQQGYSESISLGTGSKFGKSKILCVSMVCEIISSPIKNFPVLEGDQDYTSLNCCVPVWTFYIMPLAPRAPWTHSRPSQWDSLVWKVTCKCKTSLLACL